MTPGVLHIPRGLPASGKSTWARGLIDAAPAGRVVRLNRDDLRAMALPSGYARPEHTAEGVVTVLQQAPIAELLVRGVDVIVDDTNLAVRHVRAFDRIAAQAGAETVLNDAFLAVPVEECVRRDAARAHPVGEAAIRSLYDRYLAGGRTLPGLTREEPTTGTPYVPVPGTPRAIVVDIDGTVALHGGRNPYDTSRYSEDAPYAAVIEQVRLAAAAGYRVLFTSGREAAFRDVTATWLGAHVVVPGMAWDLFMRPTGDRRNDAVVKLELFDRHIRDEYDVRFVYDDRDRVVAAWRAIGLAVMQVAPGAF